MMSFKNFNKRTIIEYSYKVYNSIVNIRICIDIGGFNMKKFKGSPDEFGVIKEYEKKESPNIQKGDEVYIKTSYLLDGGNDLKGLILPISNVKDYIKNYVFIKFKGKEYEIPYHNFELVRSTGTYIINNQTYIEAHRNPKISDLIIFKCDLIKDKKRTTKPGAVLEVNEVLYNKQFIKTENNELYHRAEFILLELETVEFIFNAENEYETYLHFQIDKLTKENKLLRRKLNSSLTISNRQNKDFLIESY